MLKKSLQPLGIDSDTGEAISNGTKSILYKNIFPTPHFANSPPLSIELSEIGWSYGRPNSIQNFNK